MKLLQMKNKMVMATILFVVSFVETLMIIQIVFLQYLNCNLQKNKNRSFSLSAQRKTSKPFNEKRQKVGML